MKIHVEFNSVAEMVSFGKFVGNDAVQPPAVVAKRDKNLPLAASSWEDAYERTLANLHRAYDRLKELNDNEKIKAIINDVERAKNAKEWDERKKTEQEALENDERFCFTVRTLNVLKAENVYTLKELLKHSESDLMKFPNMGKVSLKSIKEELAKHKLKLAGVGKK
jgi:TusA-related sulfurtransferase